jgi:hypothetical protein
VISTHSKTAANPSAQPDANRKQRGRRRLASKALLPHRPVHGRIVPVSRFTSAITLLLLFTLNSCSTLKGNSSPATEKLKELEVLKVAADEAMRPRNCDYVSVNRTLGIREKNVSELMLDGLFQTPEISLRAARDLALAFWVSNSGGAWLKLSGSEQRFLGQRAPKLVYLATGNRGCKLRLSRVGWSQDHQHALVYVRFQEGSLPGAVLLELRRQESGWRTAREWAGFETIVLD